MSDYDNTNRGAIWPNDKKETDKHPDFTGKLNVEGKDFYVSAWKREEGANPKAPSLRFSIKSVDELSAPAKAAAAPAPGGSMDDFDQEIPFASYEKGCLV